MKRNYLFKTNYNNCLGNEAVFKNHSDMREHQTKWLAFLIENRLNYSVRFYSSKNSEMMRVSWEQYEVKYHADWTIEKVAK